MTNIRLRFGPDAIQPASRKQPVRSTPSIPTGFSTLDKALGIGGLPRGRITEILGRPTSGMVTLALKVMVQAQAAGDIVTFIDLGHTFNPDYAQRCQVDVSDTRFLLVRPHSYQAALAITKSLVASKGTGLIVFSLPVEGIADPDHQTSLAMTLRQLAGLLAKSPCALLFLCPLSQEAPLDTHDLPGGYALAHFVALRLLIDRERWLTKRDDIRGYRAQVQVVKNKVGPEGKQATISIIFNGTVRGDGI